MVYLGKDLQTEIPIAVKVVSYYCRIINIHPLLYILSE